jgi:formamidopyrimidine-DNA glycosylase
VAGAVGDATGERGPRRQRVGANLYGEKEGWNERFLLEGCREREPCPACGTAVVKIKTGSTSGYVCPACQTLGNSS